MANENFYFRDEVGRKWFNILTRYNETLKFLC